MAESAFESLRFKDGDMIFKSGDLAEHLYFLEAGSVELLGAQGNVFGTVPQGQSFGEAAILRGGIRSASVRAKGDVVCKRIGSEQASQLLLSRSPLLVIILEALLLQQSMHNALRAR
ncbi:MAG: hypothetical protein EBT03_06245 [Betaproteobacteria bacterium]|nr:hypothetical protein [Betaproteobacteria bacterium]NBT74426.1 hypothetical protein [Betaproteobacteria bacterium]NBY13827.1 hypothetical protein [Betaproteobacteria bacterium]NCA16056.1 hypothetical protein [Betaproteobacteria bacterium]